MESSDLDKGMAEAVAPEMPSPATIATCKWLPDDELRASSMEFGRTMFQGGLNGYRVRWIGGDTAECDCFPAVGSMCRHYLYSKPLIG